MPIPKSKAQNPKSKIAPAPLLVVGAVAFDSVRTPYGEAENILGGAATYLAVTASWFAPVRIVAVVGEDLGEEHIRVFQDRGIDTAGLVRAPGKTFRWSGEYAGDMNEARTLETQLNVFEQFSPTLPSSYLDSEFVFLGNIDPVLQLHVRRQLPQARLTGLDSMNYWIKGKPAELKKALAEVDILVINETEARMLSGISNLKKAAEALRKMGPKTLVIKRGEHGVALFSEGGVFSAPAFPLDEVHDPTGAGDSFAGGFMGYLAKAGELSEGHLRRAVIYGSVMASFAVEEFGLSRLLQLTLTEIESRFREFKSLTHFDV
ncbi:MAG TPA: PfkB family carbohydrate kinase [Terriglobia bacterium]|nr:PfkB family carbohydrate kinase [Terriglobia bacterium]